MFRIPPLVIVVLAVGCAPVDSGLNPPPARNGSALANHGALRPVARAVPLRRTPEARQRLVSPSRPAGAPTAAPPTRVPPAASTAATKRPGAISTGPRRAAVAVSLLDTLDEERVTSAHFGERPEDFEVLPEGKRSFANPWVSPGRGRFDRRVVWTNGERHEWALRRALTLPTPASVTWDLEVPAEAAFVTDVAFGTRVDANGPVVLAVRITSPAGVQTVSEQEYNVGPIHKLREWTPLRVDLAAFAGQSVTLEIAVNTRTPERGYRYTAFLAEPAIVTGSEEGATTATALGRPPNILLLVIDAQRADTVAANREKAGVLPALFPVLEQVFKDSTELTQAFAVGNQTRLSTYAFLAGQYPTYGGWHLGRWNYPDEVKAGYYSRKPPLVPLLLQKLGYRTAAVSNNLFLFGSMDVSLDVGFDSVIDHRHGTLDTVWITESATDWITRHKDERWFLMVNYNGPHLPYLPPKAVMEELASKLAGVQGYSTPYLGEIKYTDDYVARLLAHLDSLGLAKDTLLVTTADHGEIMDSRHQCYADNWDSNCLHNHGKTLFDEETHVPLAFRWPGVIAPGKRIDTPISHIDLVPTLLGLIGAEPDSRLLGRDLSGVLLGGPPVAAVPLLFEARLASALRLNGVKYIVHDPTERIEFDNKKTLYDRRRSKEELYDLVRDPAEMQNLVHGDVPCGGVGSARPEVTSCDALLTEMRGRYQAERQALGVRRGAVGMGAAPETLRSDAGEPDASAPPVTAGPDEPPEPQPVGGKPPANGSPLAGVVAPATAAVARTAAKSSSVAWLHLRFHGEGRFTGRLRATAPLAGFELVAGLGAAWTGDTVTIDALQGTEVRIGLESEATLTLELTRDGKPLAHESLYAGAYGLCLFEPPFTLDVSELAEAEAPRTGPTILATTPPGVFLWADSGIAKLVGTRAEKAEDIDEEVRDMMKEWGYTTK